MNKLREIIRFILKNSSQPNKLTKTKVTKLVYLTDWYSVQENNKQITKIDWYFDHYGPYVNDVYQMAEKDSKIEIEEMLNAYGNPKKVLKLTRQDKGYKIKLNNPEIAIINKVLLETDSMNWREFIEYVYETEPIKNNKRYTRLDLQSYAMD